MPRFKGATKVTYRWNHIGASGAPKVDGTGRAYRIRKRDRGHRLSCEVDGSNAGGPALAPPDSVTVPR